MELRAIEKRGTEVLPTSFEPIYDGEPDVTSSEVFGSPATWSTTTSPGCNMSSWAHILLGIYGPRVPKLGAGHVMVLEQVSRTLIAICEGA